LFITLFFLLLLQQQNRYGVLRIHSLPKGVASANARKSRSAFSFYEPYYIKKKASDMGGFSGQETEKSHHEKVFLSSNPRYNDTRLTGTDTMVLG
jgi:hypothetical protein